MGVVHQHLKDNRSQMLLTVYASDPKFLCCNPTPSLKVRPLEGGALMNGINVLINEPPTVLLPLPSHEVIARRQPSMNQEMSSHQTQYLSGP